MDFADQGTTDIADGIDSKAARRTLPHALHRSARRKLAVLNAADSLDDLRTPPANRLETLRGDRNGQHSIRVNDQYRICFRWTNESQPMRRLHIPKNPPIMPGEILVEEYLKPLGISQAAFAKRIGVTYHRLNEIVNGKRGVTADTALRFSKALRTTPDLWLNLQRVVELYAAMRSTASHDIDRIEPIARSA